MPRFDPESAANPTQSPGHQAGKRRRSTLRSPPQSRLPAHIWSNGPPRSILSIPSPTVGDTCTTHNEMLFWIGWFARFHLDGSPYVPYELKTIDCPVVRADGSALLRDDGQQQIMRCLREVAQHKTNGKVEWLMISWHIGVPGMTFHKCASLAKALAAFHSPVQPVQLP